MLRRLSLSIWMLALPLRTAFAQDPPPADPPAPVDNTVSIPLPNPLGCPDAEGILCVTKVLINALYTIAVPLTVIMVIWAGYQFLTAGGNEEKITAARKGLLYVAIGFGIIVLSGAFRGIIEGLLLPSAEPGQVYDNEL